MKLKNTKKDRLINVTILVVSILVAYVVIFLLFNNKDNKLNEGDFKLNDLYISNTIDITDMLLGKEVVDSKVEYDLSTNSKFNISIAKLSNSNEIKQAYIDNFDINFDYEYNVYNNIKDLKKITKDTKLDIELLDKGNTYETIFYIACLDFKKDLKLKESIDSLSLIKVLEVDIYNDAVNIFKVKFDINIVDNKDERYKASIEYNVDLTKFLNNNYYIDDINIYDINFVKVD